MKETATIISTEGKTATLTKTDQGACESCASSAFCSAKTQFFHAANPKSFALQPGDKVEVYIPSGKTVLAGFMLLIMPLMLFAVVFILSKSLFGIVNEGARAFLGLMGIAAGFGINYLYSKFRKNKTLPEILGFSAEEPSGN